MWAPGIAAIIVTLAIEKQSFKSLRLNTLGPKRYYLWAWFLPPLLIVLSGLLTVLLRVGQLDLEFAFMQQMMEQTGAQLPVSTGTLVVIQVVQALILGPLINLIFTLGEELGWRGFLLPRLMPLGQWKALIVSGFIWGIWRAPVSPRPSQPGHFADDCILRLIGHPLWLDYLNTRSPWVAALAHASLNAWAGLPHLFLKPGFDTALGVYIDQRHGLAGDGALHRLAGAHETVAGSGVVLPAPVPQAQVSASKVAGRSESSRQLKTLQPMRKKRTPGKD